MKRQLFGCVCAAALGVLSGWADPSVTSVTAKQRWPWSGTVDVDYTLVADSACDIELTATWTGGSATLTYAVGSGDLMGVLPGEGHFLWDPVKSGMGRDETLENLVVTGTAVPVSSRTYLVVDLATGDCSYLAAPPPDGGFSADSYKTDYMVFRRIPAGTYQVGDSEETSTTLFNYSQAMKETRGPRTVKVTTDYYLAIYQMTYGQAYHFTGVNKGNKTPAYAYCENYRGSATNGIDNILWPTTGHRVAEGSMIDKMRQRFKLSGGAVLDLPTSVMWEIGARAGSATAVYPNGGSVSDSDAELAAIRASESLEGGGDVGQKAPNPWGFYDLLGISYEMVLDGANYTAATGTTQDNPLGIVDPTQVVDPVGLTATPDATFRYVGCNAGWMWNKLGCTASWRAILEEVKGRPATRPCVFLRPLVK